MRSRSISSRSASRSTRVVAPVLTPATRVLVVALLAAVLAAGLMAGCTKEKLLRPSDNLRDPANGGIVPPVPTGLRAVGDSSSASVTVSWSLPDSESASFVRIYRVYHRLSPFDPFEIADSSDASPVTLRGFARGEVIRLSVSAILVNGLEGRRSGEIATLIP